MDKKPGQPIASDRLLEEIKTRLIAVGDRVERAERSVGTILTRIERRQEHVIEALVALLSGQGDSSQNAELARKLRAGTAELNASIEANKQ